LILRPGPGTLLLEQEGLKQEGLALDQLDDTRRIVPPGAALFRMAWEIEWRSGVLRRQYERWGELLVQTLFGRLDPIGIREIRVFDLYRPDGSKRVAVLGIPPTASADILMTCSFSIQGARVRRIYTFGWRGAETVPRDNYLHIDPSLEPPRGWQNASRHG
jgi:hypothetical protein